MRAQPESSGRPCGADRCRILTFIDYYLPGYKAGGSLRTVANMVDRLSDEFEFLIVTRDRDLGDPEPFKGVSTQRWIDHGHSKVMYIQASPSALGTIRTLMSRTPHDVLYLNSFFSPLMTVVPLMLRRLGMVRRVPVVLAPRGEFSPGALSLKPNMKRAFISAAKASGLYSGVTWQSSSEEEAGHTQQRLGGLVRHIVVAADVLPHAPGTQAPSPSHPRRDASGPLKVVFLSRISPNKNVDFLLRVMARVRCDVELSICGPREDPAYWARCERCLSELPANVRVTVNGGVPNGDVGRVLGDHDLFAFPTMGENFGHVIFESLSAGTPVLVSDRTPWAQDDDGALQVLPLDEDRWRTAIEAWASLGCEQRAARRNAANAMAQRQRSDQESVARNKRMFAQALQCSSRR